MNCTFKIKDGGYEIIADQEALIKLASVFFEMRFSKVKTASVENLIERDGQTFRLDIVKTD